MRETSNGLASLIPPRLSFQRRATGESDRIPSPEFLSLPFVRGAFPKRECGWEREPWSAKEEMRWNCEQIHEHIQLQSSVSGNPVFCHRAI